MSFCGAFFIVLFFSAPHGHPGIRRKNPPIMGGTFFWSFMSTLCPEFLSLSQKFLEISENSPK